MTLQGLFLFLIDIPYNNVYNHSCYPYIMEILSRFVREFIQPIYMIEKSFAPRSNQNGVPCVNKYFIF